MSNYIVDGTDLTSVADAIRAKSGGSGQLAFPADFVSEIGNIPSGGNSPLTVLSTINISENVRSVGITVNSSWLAYDFLLIKYDIALTASDWLYASKTDLSTSPSTYRNVSATTYKYVSCASKVGSAMEFLMPDFKFASISVSSNQTLYFYTYSSSKQISSGSSITIYGGLKNDL